MQQPTVHVTTDIAIGTSISAVASVIPDEMLTYAGKLIFAVLTAVIAGWVSRMVGSWRESKAAK